MVHPYLLAFKRCLFLLIASFCFFTFETASGAYDAPEAVYLTWQKNPESTMTINWITTLDRKQDGLKYRRIYDQEWIKVPTSSKQLPNKTPYLLYRIELIDLEAATVYEFQLENRDQGNIYKFKTMPETLESPIRFVVGGDMYHDDLETLLITNREAARSGPSFALVGGDIAYASDKLFNFLPRWSHPIFDHFIQQKFDRWLQWLAAWSHDMVTPEGCLIPMLPAIGNHDVMGRFEQTPKEAPFFYSLFAMPGESGYNVLDFGDYMSIFLLDSGHTNPVEGKQAEWLAKTLQQRQSVPHKFALYHVPAYPSVHKLTEKIGSLIRKYWVPSFDAYHLTAAFENHEHAYKRTHQILGNAIAVDGVVYIGDGGWGVLKPRNPRNVEEKWYLAKAASARHFVVVDVEQDKQTIHAINFDGQILDSFTW